MVSTHLNFVSFNILDPHFAIKYQTPEGKKENGECNWKQRKKEVFCNLFLSFFHIACLQETTPKTLSDLQEEFKSIGLMSNCAFAGFSKNPHIDPEAEHGVSIVYNANKVRLLGTRIFQTHLRADWSRGELYADFEDKATGLKLRVASLHLAGYKYDNLAVLSKQTSKIPGFMQLREILSEIERDSEYIDVIAAIGDLNEDWNENGLELSRHQLLFSRGYFCDGRKNEYPTERRTNRRIDGLFFKVLHARAEMILKPLKTAETLEKDMPNCSWIKPASDHFLTGNTLHLKLHLKQTY